MDGTDTQLLSATPEADDVTKSTLPVLDARRPPARALAGRLLDPVWELEIIRLQVAGMGCATCAARIRTGFLNEVTVLGADVCHRSGVAEVLYDAGRTRVDGLCEVVARVPSVHQSPYSARPHPEEPFPFR